ncbi:hypothetical protein SDC9_176503 [bioreactor metagenome]|uniref:Uncharacterized protein n=1 Tax=bioreactor metagenome TaxID=1076179 RepID=A0A645GQU6_9ZZZZ
MEYGGQEGIIRLLGVGAHRRIAEGDADRIVGVGKVVGAVVKVIAAIVLDDHGPFIPQPAAAVKLPGLIWAGQFDRFTFKAEQIAA